jgi:hypothetical protein
MSAAPTAVPRLAARLASVPVRIGCSSLILGTLRETISYHVFE